jgi:hypothetical protein
MKKILYVIVVALMTMFVSCDKNDMTNNPAELKVQDNTITYTSCVSSAEYKNATSVEKKIINQVDGALAAMELMKRDNSTIELNAIISVSLNSENSYSNSIIVSKDEISTQEKVKQNATTSSRSCKVCGLSSAYDCVKKISKDMASKDEFDVHVKRDGDCVVLSW